MCFDLGRCIVTCVSPISLCVNVFEVKNMKRRKRKYGRIKSGIIQHQADEIKSLKAQIDKLNISCKEKDELINSVEHFQREFAQILEELRDKKREYEKILKEIKAMRDALNKEVFKGRWSIIKWLIK